MRVVLEVVSGQKAGHKRWLGRNQALEIGRSELVDFALDDAKMSGRHFRLMAGRDACFVEDLNSTNGTYVNDEPVAKMPLNDGDSIVAGETSFRVRIEGAHLKTTEVDLQPPKAAELSPILTFTVEPCKSELFQYVGGADQMRPELLHERLAKRFQPMVIVDVAKVKSISASLDGAEPLFNWLPDELQAEGSPWIFTGEKADANLVDQAWGNDALVCVYCEQEEPLPWEQLRRCGGTFARPSVLRPQLCDTVRVVAEDLLLELSMVMCEDESAQSWLLFSLEDRDSLLQQFRLKKQGD